MGVGPLMYMVTLQGPDPEGNNICESWVIPAPMYFGLRRGLPDQPDEITVFDRENTVIYRGSNGEHG